MLQHFWLIVVFSSAKIIENGSFGYQTQKGFSSKEPQFNCSDSVSMNTSLFSILYPANNRTFYQHSTQYWPRNFPEKTKNVKPTTYHVLDLQNYTSYRTADRDAIQKSRACKILRTAETRASHPIEGLRIFIINSTHAFVTWRRVKAPSGANVTYRTIMKRGSHDNQSIELVCYSNKSTCTVKKDVLPTSFDVFVNVHSIKAPFLQIRFEKIDWNSITLGWNSVARYYGNVNYSVLYVFKNRGHKTETSQEKVTLKNLQQYTTYSIRLHAVRNDKVVATSEWVHVKTADFDECKANSHNCGPDDWCVNTQGSYFCESCNTGYIMNGDNCTDYDECKENVHKCDVNAECFNTQGSYSCRCNKCYTGDGYICTRIVARKFSNMNQMNSWNDSDFSHCTNKELVDIYDKLKGGSADPVAAAQQLAHLISVNQSGPLYASDIKLITNSLELLSSENVLERLSGGKTGSKDSTKITDYVMSVLNITNGILDKKLLPSWKQVPKGYATPLANKVIESNDKLALLLLKNNNTKDVFAEKDNIVLSVRGIPADDDLSDQLLPPASGMREGSVYVPSSVLRHQNSSKGMRYLSFVSYKTIHEVLQNEPEDEFTISSPVISVTLTPLSENQFDQPVVITIKQPESDEPGEPTCGFLNVSKRDDISWSTEGCEVGSSNETHIECLCYHLTSFAILMQVKDIEAEAIKKEHHFALSLISYIGLCSSVVALILVFLTFAFIRFLKLPRHFIHANLALSLCLAHVTFLFGINRTESKVLCKALAIALHYLFLVAFTWMALEGVVLYLMLVKVFHSSMSGKKTKFIFFVCGWGIPAVIVSISSGIYHDGYGTNTFCWLSLDREFIWAFVAPVLAVIGFNFLCLGGTFYVMAKRRGNNNSENKVEKLRYWTRSCCLLTCILGVTWLLGIFFVNKHSLFIAYFFSILNGFQGLMIFLLHCIGDRKIRAAYANILRCNSDPYASSSGGAKLLYKQSLPSRSGSARGHPSDEKVSDDQKRPEKQETVSQVKGTGVLKQAQGGKKEQSKSVRISDELTSKPYASAYGETDEIEMPTYKKLNSFQEASTPLISPDGNSESHCESTQMKLQPQWV